MLKKSEHVARNTFFFIAALIFQKFFSLVYFALLARFLGVEDLGKYAFAISFTTIFTIFIDFGFTPVLTRKLSQNEGDISKIFSTILSLKIFLSAIVYIGVLVLITLLHYEPIIVKLVLISGMVMIFDSFTLTFWGIFRGRHILFYESLGNILVQIILVCVGLGILFTSSNLLFQMSALLMASIFHFFYAWYLLWKKIHISFQWNFNTKEIQKLLRESSFFGIGAIFNRITGSLDSILLSKLAGLNAVGFYSTSYRLVSALQFIPLAFSASIYPAMSAAFQKDDARLSRLFEKSSIMLLVIIFPISFGAFVIADLLITTIYGTEYISSILSFKILIFSLIFTFLHFPVGSCLNAIHKQKITTKNQGIAMAVSIILNVLLIPIFGFVGASIAFLVSSMVLYGFGFWYVMHSIKIDYKYFFGKTIRIFSAAFGMAFFIFFLRTKISLLLLIVVANLTYIFFLYCFRAFQKSEIQEFIYSLRQKPINAEEKIKI